jgi:hypothetical protein
MSQVSSLTCRPTKTSERSVPFSADAMQENLRRIGNIWTECQATRDRNAIYAYLSAVYGLVEWWTVERQVADRSRRALRSIQLEVFDREGPFAAVIRSTADPAKVDKRTRSKWSRVMRFAAEYKKVSEPFDNFVKRKGGINECAARFTRHLVRHATTEQQKRCAARRTARLPICCASELVRKGCRRSI